MKQYLREHFLNHLFQALSEITFDNQIVCYLYSLALVLLFTADPLTRNKQA
jgi:hypothetical protein